MTTIKVHQATRMLMAGESQSAVSLATGVNMHRISNLRALLGLPGSRQLRKPTSSALLVKRLRTKGMKVAHIARRLGVRSEKVLYLLEPQKVLARQAAHYAMKKGKIPRIESCQLCGNDGKLTKHHADYNSPLSVIWLCSYCHRVADRIKKHREAA